MWTITTAGNLSGPGETIHRLSKKQKKTMNINKTKRQQTTITDPDILGDYTLFLA